MGIWYGVASEFTWRPCGIMHVESHNNNSTTKRTRREGGFSKLSRSTQCGTHSAFITLPDMVVWAVYACMLGRTERSARLRGAPIHTY